MIPPKIRSDLDLRVWGVAKVFLKHERSVLLLAVSLVGHPPHYLCSESKMHLKVYFCLFLSMEMLK